MMTPKTFTSDQSYEDLIAYLLQFDRAYIFRGQSDASWEIKSSYYRLAEKSVDGNWFFSKESMITSKQWEVLYNLRGRHHLVTDDIKEDDDDFSQLSYLQHFGAPTSLIDFTRKSMIALYFSLSERDNDVVPKSSIYLLNIDTLISFVNDSLVAEAAKFNIQIVDSGKKTRPLEVDAKGHDHYKTIVFHNDYCSDDKKIELITLKQPKKANQRIFAQDGCFLFPSNPSLNIEETLSNKYGIDEKDFIKVTYPTQWKYDIYNYLKKHNIHGETLFPGIEGYATKVRQDLVFSKQN